jgi:hypothetical protein
VSATPWIVGGAVAVAGGFAFWLYHKESTAAAAKAAATSLPAPHAPAASALNRAAGGAGALAGRVAGFVVPVPGLSGYGRSVATTEVEGAEQVGSGVKSLVTGHPLDAAKKVGKAALSTAAAPVTGTVALFKSLF